MASTLLTGFDKLERQLKTLPIKVAKKVVRKATKDGAKAILTQVKLNALRMVNGEMGELLYDHAKVIVFKHQRKGSWGVQIGMEVNVPEFDHYPANGGKKSYIPAAIEYGHGNAKPIPFIRKAFATKKAKATQIMAKSMKAGIEKEARRG